MREDNFIEWRILAGKLRGTLSSKEEQEFQAWYDASIRHRKYFERLGKLWDSGEESEIRVDVEGTLRTDNITFMIILVFIVYIFAALTFFPALALGPIAEHLSIWM